MRTVEIKGLKELNDALAELPRNLAKNALRGSVRAGAIVVRDDAKAKVKVVTGTLRRAIYVKHIPDQSSAVKQTFFVGVRQGKQYQKRKGGSMDAYYAKFVEYGHFTRRRKDAVKSSLLRIDRESNRGQKNNAKLAEMVQTGEVKWVPPQPFMRPAWDARQNDALKALSDYLAKRIPEEAAKVRK